MSYKDSWFKFFINLWLAGTRRLSFEAKGLYVDLIAMWRDGRRIPNDPREIALELGVRNYRTVARPLRELIERGKVEVGADGYLCNSKVEVDLQTRAEQRAHKPTPGREPADQTVLHFGPRAVQNPVRK